MNLLIHFLGFPSSFTSSLPLIILMSLLLHSLGFLSPVAFSLLIIFVCPADHYSCHSGLLGFTLLFSLLIIFILLGFFCHWAFCQKWASTINKLDFCYLFLAKIPICSVHFGNSQFGLSYFKLTVRSILTVNSLGT